MTEVKEKKCPWRERMMIVRMLAVTTGYKHGLGRDNNEDWDDEWRNVVYIELPEGQVSWHIAPKDMDLFHDFPQFDGEWDGKFSGHNKDFVMSIKPPPKLPPVDDGTHLIHPDGYCEGCGDTPCLIE